MFAECTADFLRCCRYLIPKHTPSLRTVDVCYSVCFRVNKASRLSLSLPISHRSIVIPIYRTDKELPYQIHENYCISGSFGKDGRSSCVATVQRSLHFKTIWHLITYSQDRKQPPTPEHVDDFPLICLELSLISYVLLSQSSSSLVDVTPRRLQMKAWGRECGRF